MRDGILPRPIEIGERYFSPSKLRAWGRHKLGERYSTAGLARFLGWSETATRSILRGTSSPTLESYGRALSRVEEPLGTWLDHTDRRK